jgi:hypothetical protein
VGYHGLEFLDLVQSNMGAPANLVATRISSEVVFQTKKKFGKSDREEPIAACI